MPYSPLYSGSSARSAVDISLGISLLVLTDGYGTRLQDTHELIEKLGLNSLGEKVVALCV